MGSRYLLSHSSSFALATSLKPICISSPVFHHPLESIRRGNITLKSAILRRAISHSNGAKMDDNSNNNNNNSDAGTSGSLLTVKELLCRLVSESLTISLPEEPNLQPLVEKGKFSDYQCNNAMGIFSKIRRTTNRFKNPNAIGKEIMKNLPQSDMIERTSVAGPGFINIDLSTPWIAERIRQMLLHGVHTWAPSLPVNRVVVDFSSPNIAKEMHVGHLRSTIIGDCLARILEFCRVEVLRRNHVGDWGTQFGMLLENLFDNFENWEEVGDQSIGNLQAYYKASKAKFDSDDAFKLRSQQAVVKLQAGDAKYRGAWQLLCEISRKEFNQVYGRLKVHLEEKGESFYNPYIPAVLQQLGDMIVASDGAQVIFLNGHTDPMIVVKSDGGYNYSSTDLAALWYRLNEEIAEWVIYVTDVGQSPHFDKLFTVARNAGWLPSDRSLYPKATHVPFGLVLGDDGKRFRTRSTEVVRLVDLLDEAKTRSKNVLIERGKENEWTEEELEHAAEAIGYGAVKYADLKNNRTTNYVFNFDQMLDDRGNTAVYLQYAHARICSILRKSGKDVDELKQIATINLNHENERLIGLQLIRFSEVLESVCADLLPSSLCDYLYSLSESFTKFYSTCKVVGSEEESSRLLLCEATAIVMRECFKLLGITPLYKL